MPAAQGLSALGRNRRLCSLLIRLGSPYPLGDSLARTWCPGVGAAIRDRPAYAVGGVTLPTLGRWGGDLRSTGYSSMSCNMATVHFLGACGPRKMHTTFTIYIYLHSMLVHSMLVHSIQGDHRQFLVVAGQPLPRIL